jgi:hypothetical protein
MPRANFPPKDPDDVLDYVVDWSSWLPEGDTIISSTWLLEAGAEIEQEDDSNTTDSATIWVSGGVNGKMYALTNRIATAQGRQKDRTVYLQVQTT